MRGDKLELDPIIEDMDLKVRLERMLSLHYGRERTVRQIERRISQYCSSFMLEELDVTLDDDFQLELLLKDLSPRSLFGGAIAIKPDFMFNPVREIETYRRILARYWIGAPRYYGSVVEPESAHYWLLMERLEPTMLWQMGEFSTWKRVARWMAEMHAELAKVHADAGEKRAIHLIQYDREFYWRWMRRAQKFVSLGDMATDRRSANAVDWLAARYETVVERLCSLPLTVIHGEFFASNVLINPDPNNFRVCPVDWELAALAPGYIDVAALTAGGWSREQKEEMSLAYLAAMPECGLGQPDRADFLRDMDFCRLHYAVQWLGWSAGWKPPEEHAQDWLKEALRCAEILGL
jgi:thiamine kinase-like enzyme